MTRDHARHALAALAVYCERGEAALRCLAADDPDGAAEALQRRAAAFHNFRAQDELARNSGADIAAEPEAKALMARIRVQDSELVPKLEGARERALEQATKVREARAKLARFRSSGGGPNRGNGFSRGA
jgi:hypothetical protein